MRKYFFIFIILAAVILILCPAAQAKDIYIAQIALGSDTGSNAANAHSAAWFNTVSNWGSGSGQIGPGTTIHVCGTISSSLTVQGNGTAGNPITVYFEPNAKMSAPAWPQAWWASGGAIQLYGNAYVILDGGSNGIIEATQSNSASQQSSEAILLSDVSNVEVKNFTINNMYVRTSSTDTVGGGGGVELAYACTNVSVHNNTISQAEVGIGMIYPENATMSHIKIYGNTISGNNWGISLGQQNINSYADDIQIYGNDITGSGTEWDETSDLYFHHNGIFTYASSNGDSVTNLKVFGNYIHGDFGQWVTAMIYASGNIITPLYYNNVLVSSYGVSNGFIRTENTIGARIYNNTFINNSTSMGIDAESGSDIKNNLFFNNSVGVAINLPINANTFSDNNVFYSSAGNMLMETFTPPNGTGAFYSLADWRTNFGLDKNSTTGDPHLVNPDILNGNYHLLPSSPAIGAGVNLSAYFTTDKDGNTRPSSAAWDIGAYEYVPGTPRIIYGDVSGDGTVSAYDAAQVAQYAVSLISLTPEQITRADVSGDGKVSAYDAALIAQKAVGLITKFPVEG